MTTLPPFTPDAKCPACGQQVPGKRFVAKGDRIGGSRYPMLAECNLMVRTCQGCGYSWHEAPLNREPTPTDQDEQESNVRRGYLQEALLRDRAAKAEAERDELKARFQRYREDRAEGEDG